MGTNWWIYGPVIAVFTVLTAIFYWWLLCLVVANTGGWARLAARLAAKTRGKEGLIKWQSLRVGKCSYRRSVSLASTPEGLYMRAALFFRPAHQPLFIPWDAVTSCRTSDLLGGPAIEISVDAFPIPTILQFPQALADRLRLVERVANRASAEEPAGV